MLHWKGADAAVAAMAMVMATTMPGTSGDIVCSVSRVTLAYARLVPLCLSHSPLIPLLLIPVNSLLLFLVVKQLRPLCVPMWALIT